MSNTNYLLTWLSKKIYKVMFIIIKNMCQRVIYLCFCNKNNDIL